jgi:hypothetical protein
MVGMKTPRVTMRCYVEDLGLALPGIDDELLADHPIIKELGQRAPTAPAGLKRILSIASPLVYRLRRGRHRGAVWPDDEHALFWLLAHGVRKEGSHDDPYERFGRLHRAGRLLPTDDDAARISLECASRLLREMQREIPALVAAARSRPGVALAAEVARDVPIRLLWVPGAGVAELWVAVGTVSASGVDTSSRVRDMVFALVERAAGPGEWEATVQWPQGALAWFEVARYGLLVA